MGEQLEASRPSMSLLGHWHAVYSGGGGGSTPHSQFHQYREAPLLPGVWHGARQLLHAR
jgi:hypothetical protein